MRTVELLRTETGDHGTFGKIVLPELRVYTLEPPWRGNQRNISCIPVGDYVCTPYLSKRFGSVYHVQDVPGRSLIRIHVGNFAGDVGKGLRSDTEGCIMPGSKRGWIGSQEVVLNSKIALASFLEVMSSQDFLLRIKEAYHA